MNTMQKANSLPMWIAAGLPVLLIIIQAIIFFKNARKAAREIGIPEDRIGKAVKSAVITSIGPSIVILSGMLSLLVTVGGPVGWMRLSLIGSVMFESLAAGIGTGSVGVQLGVDALTDKALTMAVWTMILCSIGWIVFATISASRMDKIQHKLTGGNSKRMGALSIGATVACFSSFVASNLIRFNMKEHSFYFGKSAIAAILGALFMMIMMRVSRKNKALQEWNLTIAMLAAMLITAIIPFGK